MVDIIRDFRRNEEIRIVRYLYNNEKSGSWGEFSCEGFGVVNGGLRSENKKQQNQILSKEYTKKKLFEQDIMTSCQIISCTGVHLLR